MHQIINPVVAGASSIAAAASYLDPGYQADPEYFGGGVVVSAHASANTKGSYTTLIASAAKNIHGLWLQVADGAGFGTIYETIMDIAVGAAASEVVKIPNLLVGHHYQLYQAVGMMYLPLFIAAGSRVSARCASAVGGAGLSVWPIAVESDEAQNSISAPNMSWTVCDAYGINTGTSNGTSYVGGDNDAFGSWASLGATLSRNYDFMIPLCSGDAAMNNVEYHIQIGKSSAAFAQWKLMIAGTDEHLTALIPPLGIMRPAALTTSSQLQVRAACSGTADAIYPALYLFGN